jgi:tripartite-type tricarboxylate transporter receptor subunit TctC
MAQAQPYPTRPVRIFVGFGPGSAADIIARLIGQRLSERLGQPFVIENRSGAGGTLAVEEVVRSSPDGYTLLLVNNAEAVHAALNDKLSFNIIRDIVPIASIARGPLVQVVHPSFPAKTVPEFIAYAKANPGKIAMASAGVGSTGHLAQELFKMLAGVEMVHVPYRGNGPALTDLLGGQVQALIASLPSVIGSIKAGKVRALAVTTSMRADTLPELAAAGEFVPGYEVSSWYGIAVPRKTPAAVIETLNREVNAGLADAKLKAKLAEQGGIIMPGTPDDFAKLIAEETEKWGKVIRAADIKPE